MGSANLEKADDYKRMIFKRTGLKSSELHCPREKSEITPCIARDGGLALAESAGGGRCAGCDYSLNTLHKKELSLVAASGKDGQAS